MTAVSRTAVSLHGCITARLYHCTAASLHGCITAVSLHCCITARLYHCCVAALLCHCTAATLPRYALLHQHRYNTACAWACTSEQCSLRVQSITLTNECWGKVDHGDDWTLDFLRCEYEQWKLTRDSERREQAREAWQLSTERIQRARADLQHAAEQQQLSTEQKLRGSSEDAPADGAPAEAANVETEADVEAAEAEAAEAEAVEAAKLEALITKRQLDQQLSALSRCTHSLWLDCWPCDTHHVWAHPHVCNN